jgi:hypothetical protein
LDGLVGLKDLDDFLGDLSWDRIGVHWIGRCSSDGGPFAGFFIGSGTLLFSKDGFHFFNGLGWFHIGWWIGGFSSDLVIGFLRIWSGFSGSVFLRIWRCFSWNWLHILVHAAEQNVTRKTAFLNYF